MSWQTLVTLVTLVYGLSGNVCMHLCLDQTVTRPLWPIFAYGFQVKSTVESICTYISTAPMLAKTSFTDI